MSDSRYFSYDGDDIIPSGFQFLNWTVVKVNNDTELNHILKLMEWHHVIWISGKNPTKWSPRMGKIKIDFPFYLTVSTDGKLGWCDKPPQYYYRPVPTKDFLELYHRERLTHEDPMEDVIHITRADLLDLFKKKAYEVGYNYLDSWRLNNKHIAEVIDSIPKYSGAKPTEWSPKVIPGWVHDEDRIADIKDAITRYIYEKKDIPWEWIDELRDIQTLHGGNITF